jgi:hypothetical protein
VARAPTPTATDRVAAAGDAVVLEGSEAAEAISLERAQGRGFCWGLLRRRSGREKDLQVRAIAGSIRGSERGWAGRRLAPHAISSRSFSDEAWRRSSFGRGA